MAPYTLDQDAQKGDLILIWRPGKILNMLLVKFTTDNNASKDASSIRVQPVNMHIPDQKGYWALSGPEVYYFFMELYGVTPQHASQLSKSEYDDTIHALNTMAARRVKAREQKMPFPEEMDTVFRHFTTQLASHLNYVGENPVDPRLLQGASYRLWEVYTHLPSELSQVVSTPTF